ncbi:MAG: hypothetical protein QXD13_00375 [Candidatus Pacearchaeota archaeon]
MKKEDISKLAEILTMMRTSSEELESAYRKRDEIKLNELKRKIKDLQMQIERML